MYRERDEITTWLSALLLNQSNDFKYFGHILLTPHLLELFKNTFPAKVYYLLGRFKNSGLNYFVLYPTFLKVSTIPKATTPIILPIRSSFFNIERPLSSKLTKIENEI